VTFLPHRDQRFNFVQRVSGASLAATLVLSLPLATPQSSPSPDSTTVLAARQALSEGRPYLASRLLAPLFATSTPRDSTTVLLAARAAAGWEAWGTVVRLLDGAMWIDRLEAGEGRALLARARVEQSADAVRDALAAVATAPAIARGPRLVTLARAFDRAGDLDSAASAYRRAAELLPAIRDWLLLRAAGVEKDSSARESYYRQIDLAAALPRIRWTEAIARDRTGDPAGAAEVYDALGATLASLRLRLRATSQPDSLADIRRSLNALLAPRRSADDARGAIALLDANFAPLTIAEELQVARRAGVDRAARAASGFARVAAARALTDADRYTYGTVLARLGRHREAMAAFASVKARSLRADAEYARARSLLAVGRGNEALAAFRKVVTRHGSDTATAALAGYLAAEILVDRRDDPGARREFLIVAKRFPRTTHGSRAAFQAALIALIDGDTKTAAAEFATLADRPGDRSETAAALYWSGRALDARGDSVSARAQWQKVWARFPSSYYVLPAAIRLRLPAELPPKGEAPPAPDTAIAAVLDRAGLLEETGLRTEARFEYDRLARESDAAPASLPAIAEALAGRGLTARAYRLAQRSGDARLQRLVYPIPYPVELFDAAAKAGVDPHLAAAIIRQESGFEPTARSRADALGLMQVLPSVGAALARAEGIRDWEPALLFQAEVNIRFGISHLAQMLRRYARPEHALAAYNAGSRPAQEWLSLPGAAQDPEVFIERIQYVETRDYVRRVLRNLSMYRALYPGAR
jgi:peptidoglycan lytic transglycosylase